MSLSSYLTETLHARWGTSYDLKLLAKEFELPISLLNRHTGKFLVRSELPGPQITVGFKDCHFTLVRLGRKPSRKSRCGTNFSRRSTQVRNRLSLTQQHRARVCASGEFLCGGVRTFVAGTSPGGALPQFQSAGTGEDGILHVVRNCHDLAIMLANFREEHVQYPGFNRLASLSRAAQYARLNVLKCVRNALIAAGQFTCYFPRCHLSPNCSSGAETPTRTRHIWYNVDEALELERQYVQAWLRKAGQHTQQLAPVRDRIGDESGSARPQLVSQVLQVREQLFAACHGPGVPTAPMSLRVRTLGPSVQIGVDVENSAMQLISNPHFLEDILGEHVDQIDSPGSALAQQIVDPDAASSDSEHDLRALRELLLDLSVDGELVRGGAPKCLEASSLPITAMQSVVSSHQLGVSADEAFLCTVLNVQSTGVETLTYEISARQPDIPPPPGTVLAAECTAALTYDFGLGAACNSVWDYTLDSATLGSSQQQTLDSADDYSYVPWSAHTSVVGLGPFSPVCSLYAAVFDSDDDGGYTPSSCCTSRMGRASSGPHDRAAGDCFDSDIDNGYSPNSLGTSRLGLFDGSSRRGFWSDSDSSDASVRTDLLFDVDEAFSCEQATMVELPTPAGPPCALHPLQLWVQGGAPKKRPYPFGLVAQEAAVLQVPGSGAGAGSGSGSGTGAAGVPPPPRPSVVLMYHGTFGPFHQGHRACIHRAV
eukprot:6462469-Amphidinium_carterae.1